MFTRSFDGHVHLWLGERRCLAAPPLRPSYYKQTVLFCEGSMVLLPSTTQELSLVLMAGM